MGIIERARAAYGAFTAPPIAAAHPTKDAVKLRSMPRQVPGRRAQRRRFERVGFDYRRWTPPDVEDAEVLANGGGNLFKAASIAAWVKSNPVVHGVIEPRVSTPWLPYGVKYSEGAAAWLKGTDTQKGWAERIASPAEREVVATDEYVAGWGGGIFVWNEQKGHPEFVALDNAGFRYLPGEDRYQYHGWSRVFDVEPGNGIWALKRRVTSDPWRDGAWRRLAYAIMDAVQGAIQRAVWIHGFSLPTVLAKFPLGATSDQGARFTNLIIGSALRAIGVTPGYDFDYKQSTAEGGAIFKDVEAQLEHVVSIDTWGTIGLLAGGSGFSNSDLFEQLKSFIISKEAEREAFWENDQIWGPAIDWAIRSNMLPKSAAQACVEYNTETPLVIIKKSQAAKGLMDAGYSPEEAQLRAGIAKQNYGRKKLNEVDGADTKQALNGAQIASAVEIVTSVATGQIPRAAGVAQLQILLNVESAQAEQMMGEAGAGFVASIDGAPPPAPPPGARLPDMDGPPEPSYSETMADRMNARGDLTCPHGQEKYCPSCGVRRRHIEKDGQWVDHWMAVRVQ